MAFNNSWVISDTHFGHQNIIRFKKPDGELIRPGFMQADGWYRRFDDDIQLHDEMLIQRWNERVKPGDRVYHLGDFGAPLEIAARLNGKIKLILGNHDDKHSATALGRYMDAVVCSKHFKEGFKGLKHSILMIHYPVHAAERDPAPRHICVHGHIHEKLIKYDSGRPNPWYVNMCVEHTNHAPVHWDDFVQKVNRNAREIGEYRE